MSDTPTDLPTTGSAESSIVVNEVVMTRQGFSGAILLVEGDSDQRFFSSRVSLHHCEIVNARGKQPLLEALRKLNASNTFGVVAICDDDCDTILGVLPLPNLVYTDTRDLETLLARSSALDAVIAEHGSVTARRCLSKDNQTPHFIILGACLTYGQLRLLARTRGVPLNFREWKIFPFLRPDLSIDIQAMISAASSRLGMPEQDVIAAISAMSKHDPWTICQGHDVISAILIGLQHGMFGTRAVNRTIVESSLRQSIPSSEWQSTAMYQKLKQWESSNQMKLLA